MTSNGILPNRRNVRSGLSLASNGPEKADVGVLLLNMGGPDSTEAIRPFLTNIFNDRRIIELPGGRIGQKILGTVIVASRIKEVIGNYSRIGGSSPIVRFTTGQMESLQSRLNEQFDEPIKVGMAMRYWHPFADEALREMEASGVKHVVGLTLYPHYTQATTGSSWQDLNDARDRIGGQMSLSSISQWPEHPGYLDLWADRISTALNGMEPGLRKRIQLIVTAHGLPVRFVERGDPYVEHVKATMNGVLERIDDPPPSHLAFQSRTGPVEWVGPGTEDVIAELGAKGHDALLMWPISFVSDHIETTFEVDMLFREEAERAGIKEYFTLPGLNDDPALADILADLVKNHLAESHAGDS